MAITSVRLVYGAREMVIVPRTEITLNTIDVPLPEIREVAEPRADDDGDVDTTELFGSRSASLEMEFYVTPAALVDELKRFCHPGIRPYLYITDDEWTEDRRLWMRADTLSDPIEAGADDIRRDVQVQWKVPNGIWQSTALHTEVIAADVTATVGLSFPVSFPFGFAATTQAGASVVNNAGSLPVHHVTRMYGPCNGPRLTNEETGETLDFSSPVDGSILSLAEGDYLEINSQDRSALLLSNSDQSRLRFLDFMTSTWWRLQPGQNQIRYHPVEVLKNNSIAEMDFHPAWL